MDTFVDKNGKPVLVIDDTGTVTLDKLIKKIKEEIEDDATKSKVLPKNGEDSAN